jgi:capsular exopolysaccharide synthesis family protein
VEDAAARVRANLSVDPVKESRLVKVTYRDPSPERARQILSTLVGVYVDRNIDVALDSTNAAAEWLRGQVDKLKQELDGTEMALHDYKTGNRILSISLDDQSNMLRQEIQQLSQALTEVRVRRAKVAAQAEEFTKLAQASSEGQDVSGSELLKDGPLQQLRITLSDAIAQRDALIGEGKAAMHPSVASAEARVKAARDAVAQEARNMIQAVERDRSITEHEVQNLSALLEQAQQRALHLGRLEVDYRRLERAKANTEKLYSLVIERSKESDLTRMMRFNNIQTIDPPTTPKAPVSPRVPLNLALGMVGGLALGLFAAFAREMFDQTVKSPADIEHELGMTFLGFVPRFDATLATPVYGRRSKPRRRRAEDVHPELIVHDDPMSAASEAARAIRTNISFMSPDKPYRTLLITSAGPSEGKTTVACCIATAMAQAGHRTLLVDADLRRPRVHRVFDRTNDRGLSDALVDRSKLSELIVSTQVPGLSVLLSGPSCPSPAENLQSESFQKVLAELESRFDRVLIDSPPVAPITDAVILSTRVDATLLVVRALTSARETVRHARRSLQDVRANLIGAVLNAADPSRRGYPEYYRYYGNREAEVESPKQSAKPGAPAA